METSKLNRYLELKNLEAEIAKEINQLKEEIRLSFPLGETQVDGIKITKRQNIRIDLDKNIVLEKVGKKAYRECEKATQYEVITVKKI